MGAITAEIVDAGEKRDVRGRRRVPADQRARMVKAYRTSGLTMAEFAGREAINYSTFAGWTMKVSVRPETQSCARAHRSFVYHPPAPS